MLVKHALLMGTCVIQICDYSRIALINDKKASVKKLAGIGNRQRYRDFKSPKMQSALKKSNG